VVIEGKEGKEEEGERGEAVEEQGMMHTSVLGGRDNRGSREGT
jgi:hypothetical protein